MTDFEYIKEKIGNIEGRLDTIDKKLDNHITHIVADVSALRTDISWLKNNGNGKKMSITDAVQNANLNWLTKFLFVGIGLIISLLIEFIKYFMLK